MVEIYRDARDFQNVASPYALGIGYGYDAKAGGWSSSSGHGSSFGAARHLTAADPTESRQSTHFDDAYTNSVGLAPVGCIAGFLAGNTGDLIVGMAAADTTTAPPADSGEATASADSTTTALADTTTAPADSTTPPPADSTTATGDAAPADSTAAPADSGSTSPADTGSTPEVPPPPPPGEAPPPAAPRPPKRPPRPSMSESELVNRMAAAPIGAGLTKAGIKALVNTLFEEIVKSLVAGEEFTFTGFGRFYVAQTKERIGRNPNTGETITIPAKKVPRFKPGKMLKDSLMPPAGA